MVTVSLFFFVEDGRVGACHLRSGSRSYVIDCGGKGGRVCVGFGLTRVNPLRKIRRYLRCPSGLLHQHDGRQMF